jgi:uncharacterized protein YdaU (DUF1376 family)
MTDIWYPRYVGDYQRKTSHLSILEHGAYNLLLDHYYATGRPIPAIASVLHRVCRAFAADEQAAVAAVIAEFFYLENGLYYNKKAEKELAKRCDLSEKRRLAAQKRYNRTDANAHPIADAIAEQLDTQPQPQPTISYPTDMAGKPPLVNDDLKSRIFGPALDWLAKQSGKPPDKLRSIIGRWCKNHGDGRVIEALQQAAKQSPLDPISYVEKVLKNAKRSHNSAEDNAARALATLAELTNFGGLEGVRATEGGDTGPIIDMDSGSSSHDAARY